MENPRRPFSVTALRAALVAAGLVALALGLWKMLHPAVPVDRPPAEKSERERVGEILKKDRENLANSGTRDAEVYGALVRLSQHADEFARQEAVKRSRDPSALVREGAASALGYFGDDEALAVLGRLAGDPEKAVRVQTLLALGFKPGEGRESRLREALKKPGVSVEERTAAWTSLAKVAGKPEDRATPIAELVKIAGTEKNESLASVAGMEVLSLAPRDPAVLELLRKYLTEGRNAPALPNAFRHLAVLRDPWVLKNYGKFVNHPDARLRLAALQSMHFVCPADRWSVLEAAITGERDRQVLAQALQEPRAMQGPEAVAFVERIIAHQAEEKLLPEELNQEKQLLTELKSATGSDPCYAYLKK